MVMPPAPPGGIAALPHRRDAARACGLPPDPLRGILGGIPRTVRRSEESSEESLQHGAGQVQVRGEFRGIPETLSVLASGSREAASPQPQTFLTWRTGRAHLRAADSWTKPRISAGPASPQFGPGRDRLFPRVPHGVPPPRTGCDFRPGSTRPLDDRPPVLPRSVFGDGVGGQGCVGSWRGACRIVRCA
jgi:hypothetical protein